MTTTAATEAITASRRRAEQSRRNAEKAAGLEGTIESIPPRAGPPRANGRRLPRPREEQDRDPEPLPRPGGMARSRTRTLLLEANRRRACGRCRGPRPVPRRRDQEAGNRDRGTSGTEVIGALLPSIALASAPGVRSSVIAAAPGAVSFAALPLRPSGGGRGSERQATGRAFARPDTGRARRRASLPPRPPLGVTASRICPAPGCRTRTRGGRCPEHRIARPYSRADYRHARAQTLTEETTCWLCGLPCTLSGTR